MELPDDIISIIREYSKPLNRRIISNYWQNQGVEYVDEMASIVLREFKEGHDDEALLRKCSDGWVIYDECDNILRFNETQLLEWSGEFNYEDDVCDSYILCKDDIMYKQLLNNTHVVKEQMIFPFTDEYPRFIFS